METTRLSQLIDIYTWAKVLHVAAQKGRNVQEVANELLEEETDKELKKGFANRVEPTHLKAVRGALRRSRGVRVEPTRKSAGRTGAVLCGRKVESTHRSA